MSNLTTDADTAHVDLPSDGGAGSRRSPLRWLLLAAGLAVAVALPWFVYPPIAMDIVCWALFAIALDILLGYCGLLSFGHAAFWGGSAYATGLVAVHYGVPFPLAVLAGMLFAMAIAVPIGYLSVRATGIYFAMVTLAFAQMIYFIANQWRGRHRRRERAPGRAQVVLRRRGGRDGGVLLLLRRPADDPARRVGGLADRALSVRTRARRHPRQLAARPRARLRRREVQGHRLRPLGRPGRARRWSLRRSATASCRSRRSTGPRPARSC